MYFYILIYFVNIIHYVIILLYDMSKSIQIHIISHYYRYYYVIFYLTYFTFALFLLYLPGVTLLSLSLKTSLYFPFSLSLLDAFKIYKTCHSNDYND